MKHITLGYPINETELAVVAIFNVDNLRLMNPGHVIELKEVIKNLNHRLQTNMYNRQDAPDFVDLSNE